MCRDIKSNINNDVRKVFQRTGESLNDELAKIRAHEKRINTQNEKQILKLNELTLGKKQLAVELRQIIDTVKTLDHSQKQTTNELNRVTNAYDEKMKDITGSGQLQRQKQALIKMKV
jgi:hypothetical protein